MIGGYVAFVRAVNAEASAIFASGGDAGLWDVGIIVVTALLIPGAVLLLVSLVISPWAPARRSAAIAAYAGVALLVPTVWLAVNIYPPDKETSEGSPLDPAQWDHVADLYLVAFVLMGAAGTLLLVSALPTSPRRASENASQSTSD
jgi:hypothetical protein